MVSDADDLAKTHVDSNFADSNHSSASSSDLTVEVDLEEQNLARLASELPQQYELFDKVSEGGMGAIYRARNRYTKAFYAIKILRAGTTADEIALQRFIVEAKSAALLNHPNICRVNDFGLTVSNIPYLVMDWIDGISLGQKIQRDLKIAPAEAIRIFEQISAALQHAHANKVVHRDLKPDNIMLTRSIEGATNAHLVDFGIAKVMGETDVTPLGLTQTGVLVGTPLFMSPEQATGGVIDGRTDIYCFGCVMYFALSGKPPFLGANFIATINKHLYDSPLEFASSLKISDKLRLIVFRCMEKNPAHRYQTAAALSSDLKNLALGRSIGGAKLASARKQDTKKLLVVVSFILGFAAMYFVSIWVQVLFDAVPKKTRSDAHQVNQGSSAIQRTSASKSGSFNGHTQLQIHSKMRTGP